MTYDHLATNDRTKAGDSTNTGTDTRTIDHSDVLAGLLVLTIMAFLVWMGFAVGVNIQRKMDVSAGVARWEPVGSEGEVEFKYVVPAPVTRSINK